VRQLRHQSWGSTLNVLPSCLQELSVLAADCHLSRAAAGMAEMAPSSGMNEYGCLPRLQSNY